MFCEPQVPRFQKLSLSSLSLLSLLCAGRDGADGDQVSLSRCLRLVCRQDLLEITASVSTRRRRAEGQVRAVGRDQAASGGRSGGRLASVVGAAPPAREAHATRADPRHGARLRRTLAQLLPLQRRARQYRHATSPVSTRTNRHRSRQLSLVVLRTWIYDDRGKHPNGLFTCGATPKSLEGEQIAVKGDYLMDKAINIDSVKAI